MTLSASGSTDSQSGLDHYKYKIGAGPWTAGGAYPVSNTQTCLSFRVVDRVGNASAASSPVCGFSDQSAPSNPTQVSESHGIANNTWQSAVSDPAFSWSGAADSLSWVAGYNVYWGTHASGTSSSYQTANTYEPGTVGSGVVHYLQVQTKDAVGNLFPWVTLFIFQFDDSLPTNPTTITESHTIPNQTWQNTVNDPSFSWSGAEAASGIAGYYVYWGTSASGTSTTYQTTASYTPAPVSASGVYYLRLQTRDNIGNLSLWQTLFTFQYDTEEPEASLQLPAQAGLLVPVGWSGADIHSGVTSYDLQVCTAPDCSESSPGWSDYLMGAAQEEIDYVASQGQLVHLRVRAHDAAGNQSEWQAGGPVAIEAVTKYYHFNGQPVAMRQGGQVSYLHTDHLGSISSITDDTGEPLYQARYSPFGEVRWSQRVNLTDKGYTGERAEVSLGLMDYNARFYSPMLGRFISPDSLIPEPGNVLAWDRFAYSANNPLTNNDPSGHCWGVASFIRGLPSYGTTCNNLDMALTIVQSDQAGVKEKAVAGGYILTEGVAHAGLLVGAGVLAYEAAGTLLSAGTAACADGDCSNEFVQGGNVLKTAAERGQEAVQKVVNLFGDDVVAKNVPYKVYGPKGFSSDIDVVVAGKIPKLIEVGGYAKSFNMSEFGKQITNLYKLAQLEEAEAFFYYVKGTPQQVVDYAIRKLGEGNVLPIP